MENLKRAAKSIVVLGLVLTMASTAFAQTATSEQRAKPSGGPRRQLATILFAGLGGAVLGLSTLSFYGRPQDKLANIAYGFAFGVIGGTAYVTYKAAAGTGDFYGQTGAVNENDWLYTNKMAAASVPTPPVFAANFEF